jgi:hypothetical protein
MTVYLIATCPSLAIPDAMLLAPQEVWETPREEVTGLKGFGAPHCCFPEVYEDSDGVRSTTAPLKLASGCSLLSAVPPSDAKALFAHWENIISQGHLWKHTSVLRLFQLRTQ